MKGDAIITGAAQQVLTRTDEKLASSHARPGILQGEDTGSGWELAALRSVHDPVPPIVRAHAAREVYCTC
jgi:hypothetical protein